MQNIRLHPVACYKAQVALTLFLRIDHRLGLGLVKALPVIVLYMLWLELELNRLGQRMCNKHTTACSCATP